MAVDIMLLSENLDVVVIVSGDGDFVRLIEAVQMKGVRCEVISFGISTSNELIEAADQFTEICTLSGIFRNAPSGPGVQVGHSRGDTGPIEVRGSYSYSAYSITASNHLPAERVSGEKERARLATQHVGHDGGPRLSHGERQSAGYGFATHEEPFMLPDSDACGDPHSVPLARPTSVSSNGSPGDHENG
jgi:hypothetical protein